MKSVVWSCLVMLAAVGGVDVLRGNAHYPSNQAPLQATPFVALPLGSVRAEGWLLAQLEAQRAGLTGHAEEALREIGPTSAWRGGDGENWEKSPYYIKGLIPLAYTLNDDALKRRAQVWVDWVLSSQRPDGFYGPASNDDWWPRMVSNYFLRDYYEATNDERVLPFLSRYYRYLLTTMPQRPLKEWGKSRAGDEMDTAIWLYNRTREPFLLEVVDLLRTQAYDWPAIMHENRFQGFGNDYQPKHNVNVPQAMKMPAVSWQRTGDARERTAIEVGSRLLMRDHGLSLGMQSGTEFLAGRSPGQGIEFCSIVEQMLSDETIVRIYGEGQYADRLEQMAFNALPAAWNRELTALRYYTLPNHVTAHRGTQGFGQNYDNGIVYGPRSGFPCCCFNVHHGWPKFVQNSWAATDDNGLAAIAYAPSAVTAKVGEGGATATIAQRTTYPFDQTVRFTVNVSEPTTFPLALRTPAWCTSPTLSVNGDAVEPAARGEFVKVNREWRTGDEVVLTLPMDVRVQPGVHGSVSVHRGPLLYSLAISSERRTVGQPAPGYDEIEARPTTPWNFALALDAQRPQQSIELRSDATDANAGNPFDGSSPSRAGLTVAARRVPGWDLAWNGNVAFDPPMSPVQSESPVEQVTLVPVGTQDLRLTDFPVLGESPRPAGAVMRLDFDDNDPSALVWYGGNWWASDGKLRTAGNGGAPGYKALIENATYTNVEVSAQVTPAERGDAGIVVRVNRPSIGADAFEGYYAGIDAEDGVVLVGKMDGRSFSELRRVQRPIPRGQAQRLRVSAVGDQIAVWLNDEPQPVLSVTDSSWTSGQVGVRMWSNDSDRSFAIFDDLDVMPK